MSWMDGYFITLCILLSLMMIYLKRKKPLKVYRSLGCVYENELEEVKTYVRILDTEFVSIDIINGKEIKKYSVMIYEYDRYKFIEIMKKIIEKGNFKSTYI